MNTITNKEAALLNLLSEKPKHAYEIELDIKERDMRFWTEISMSSVYKLLNKLEAQQLLRSTVRLSKKQVAQKVYSLTARGRKAFKEKLALLLSTWEASKHPLDIGLASLWLLGNEEAIALLTKYGEHLERMLVMLRRAGNVPQGASVPARQRAAGDAAPAHAWRREKMAAGVHQGAARWKGVVSCSRRHELPGRGSGKP